MKILCFFLLWILAVSVFGEPQELNGILGESVKFPAAVKIEGSWMYGTLPIGDVTSGRFTAARNEKFSGRLHWDSSTGFFSLSALRMEDSGVYTVQDRHQKINTIFQLNVYKDNVPVLKPNVSITHNEYPCTIECTAERGTGVTLSWYREGQKEPYVSSRVASAPYLHLPETVESGTYTCEAKNSVSSETSDPLTVGPLCTAPSSLSAGTIAAIFIAVVAVLIAVVVVFLYRHEKRQAVIREVVRRLFLVIKLLDNIVEPASDEDRQAFIYDAFTRLIVVYEISEDIVAPAHVEEMQALRSNVLNLLGILVAPGFDIRSLILGIGKEHAAIRTTILDGDEQAVFLSGIGKEHAAIRTTILDGDEQAVFLSDIRSLILDIRSVILDIRSKNPGTKRKMPADATLIKVMRSKQPAKKLQDNVDPPASRT